ncbi:MAG: SDR family oxidoreductase [Acidimicrobiales bacterium]
MEVSGRTAIVTGGAGGIGAAIARQVARAGGSVLITDIDGTALDETVAQLSADGRGRVIGQQADVADPGQIRATIDHAEAELGPVSIYFANAGITGPLGLGEADADWDQVIDINLRAHVRAANVLIPRWLDRGEGYFVSTASAAGLLSQIGAAGYSVTKHGAVAFAEWLSITYGDAGVRVSCLCPMGVATKMLLGDGPPNDPLAVAGAAAVTSAGDVLQPDDVAADVMAAIADERFLILPHEDVLRMFRFKGSDYERWLRGMRRYQARLLPVDPLS